MANSDIQDAYSNLVANDPVIASIESLMESGLDELDAMKAVIVLLSDQKSKVIEELQYFQSIAPRIVKKPMGETMRFDVPSRFIRVHNL